MTEVDFFFNLIPLWPVYWLMLSGFKRMLTMCCVAILIAFCSLQCCGLMLYLHIDLCEWVMKQAETYFSPEGMMYA